ncbi:MAG: hypothetical protein K6F73_08630 [Lachnospiraceae bacterium]|nr:hypothetical protein [Lachnospiraceae bacterium]
MKKAFSAIIITVVCTLVIAGCGKKEEETAAPVKEITVVESGDSAPEEKKDPAAETAAEDVFSDIKAIADIDVEKKVFDVELTIPKEFADDITQEELDKAVNEKGYKSATLNEDGSVTYVMTKDQHREMVDEVKKGINESLAEMAGSEDYPEITKVTANDNYTSFAVTTKNEEPSMMESMSVLGFYMTGGMYSIYSGEDIDNVHVEFINAATGEVIGTTDSKDMGKE